MTVRTGVCLIACLTLVAACANTGTCTCAIAETEGETFEEGLSPGEDGTCESRAESSAYLYCFASEESLARIANPDLSAASLVSEAVAAARQVSTTVEESSVPPGPQ